MCRFLLPPLQFPLLFSRRGGPEKPRWQFSINWKCQWPAAIKLPGILKGPLAQRIARSSVCRWLLSVHCSFCGRPVARINYEKAPKFGIFWWHVPTIFSICHFLFSISDFQLPLCSFFFFFCWKSQIFRIIYHVLVWVAVAANQTNVKAVRVCTFSLSMRMDLPFPVCVHSKLQVIFNTLIERKRKSQGTHWKSCNLITWK